ncbi:conjugal transfer protein [Bacteroidia bacterium]|nr:conjugal transfer protein [Bacteroidia bacterium]
MKKLFFVFIIMLCFAVPDLPAQRYLPGQRGLQVTAGTVNGLNPQDGFHSGIAFSQYTKSADRWVFGAEYLEKRHPYKDTNIPQSQFTVDAGYYLKFLSDRRKTFFVSLGTSAMAGYETVNWNDKVLFDGATINNKDAFLYGGALTLESEIYLTDRLVLLANVRERLLAGSSAGKLNTMLGLGIKIIIN